MVTWTYSTTKNITIKHIFSHVTITGLFPALFFMYSHLTKAKSGSSSGMDRFCV
jgi:hypothetical protein